MIGTDDFPADLHGAACVRLRPSVVPAGVLQAAEVVVDARRAGVHLADGSLEDRERAAIQRLGLVEAAGVLEEDAEVVERIRRFQGSGAEDALGDGDRLAEDRLRLGVAAARAVDAAQPTERAEADPLALEPGRRALDELERAE